MSLEREDNYEHCIDFVDSLSYTLTLQFFHQYILIQIQIVDLKFIITTSVHM